MPAQRVHLFTKFQHRLMRSHMQSSIRQIENLRERLAEAVGRQAKLQHRLNEKAKCCQLCPKPPTVFFIACHHAYCEKCATTALWATGMKVRCPHCTSLDGMQSTPLPGKIIKHDGQGWISEREEVDEDNGDSGTSNAPHLAEDDENLGTTDASGFNSDTSATEIEDSEEELEMNMID